MNNNLECSTCGKKYRHMNRYLKHVETELKKQNCKCNKEGGRRILLSKKKIPVYHKSKPKTEREMKKVFSEAQNILNNTMKQIEKNSTIYGLKNNMNKKEYNKLPIEIKEKVGKLVMENEYLKGLLSSQEKQIRLMKKQIEKCISKSTIQYVVK